MKYYAGIGSRQTPKNILEDMKEIGKSLSKRGYTLRSGGAIGADTAFERFANSQEIFTGNEIAPIWAKIFTQYFHPVPHKLSFGTQKMMDRNAMQILGYDGNTPVDFIVCWTKDGKASGGTGQAIRIANYFKIPVYNLYNISKEQFMIQFDLF